MAIARMKCMYKAKIYLVVELAKKFGLEQEILRARLVSCEERVPYEGSMIPVVTDHELRRVNSGMNATYIMPHTNMLNREWLAKPLVPNAVWGDR